MSLNDLIERLQTKEQGFKERKQAAQLLADATTSSQAQVAALEALLKADDNEKNLVKLIHLDVSAHEHVGQSCRVPEKADTILRSIHKDIGIHREILSKAEEAKKPSRKVGELTDIQELIGKVQKTAQQWHEEIEKLKQYGS